MPASFLGTAQDPWGNTKFVFEAELTLNRKDFGLNWNAALETGGFLVGDEVKVIAVDSGEVTADTMADWQIGRLECFQRLR